MAIGSIDSGRSRRGRVLGREENEERRAVFGDLKELSALSDSFVGYAMRKESPSRGPEPTVLSSAIDAGEKRGRSGKRPRGASDSVQGEEVESATPKPPAPTRSFRLAVKVRVSRGQETTSQFL
jgi:hypothetical protein